MKKEKIKIISGGQTGADRAALDWAIEHGFEHGGWCPKGRIAEDGIIPEKYHLVEIELPSYQERTIKNILDSDGTVIFSIKRELQGGSLFTLEKAIQLGKPVLHVYSLYGITKGAELLAEFIINNKIRVLNIAGPRASQEPTIVEFVKDVLEACLGENGIYWKKYTTF